MDRKKIPPEIQARILAESRRRCALCFGLDRDISRKRGQLAHLGKDPSKTDESELAFLCFDHHDEFDSTTRQSKNLMREEIERYRDQLYLELERLWAESGPLDQPTSSGPPISINLSISGGSGGAGGVFGGGGGGGAGIGGGGSGGGMI